MSVPATDYVAKAATHIKMLGNATGEAAETRQVSADVKIARVHLGNKMTLAAELGRGAWVPVKRRIDVRFELDHLPSNRWISDVARLRPGSGSQHQRSASGMQALPFSS
jgi:hypothetical protein